MARFLRAADSQPVFDNNSARRDLRELSCLANVEIRYTQELIRNPKSQLSELRAILPDVVDVFVFAKSWYDTLHNEAEDPRILGNIFSPSPDEPSRPRRWKKFHEKSRSLLKDMQSRRERSGWHIFHCLRGQQHHRAAGAIVEVAHEYFGGMPLYKNFFRKSMLATSSPMASLEVPADPPVRRTIRDPGRDSGVEMGDTPDRLNDYDFGDGPLHRHGRSTSIASQDRRRVASAAFWPEHPKDSQRLCDLPQTDPVPWKWFFDLPLYKNWKTGKTNSFKLLPVVASSGVGKTVLSNSIIRDIRTSIEFGDDGIGKSFVLNFSFLHDREYHKSALWMLRSCISQLIDFNVDPKLSSLGPSGSEEAKGNIQRPLSWPLERLWERFVDMLRDCFNRNINVYWVLDGLNDCEEESRLQFLKLLRQFAFKPRVTTTTIATAVASSSSSDPSTQGVGVELGSLHILITSTPDRELEMELDKLKVRSLDLDRYRNDEIRVEIDDYISRNVDHLCDRYELEDSVRKVVKGELHKRHDGHFLWASVLVGRFEKCQLTRGRIREILNSTPQNLSQNYGNHLRHARTSTGRGSEIKQILSILVAAQRYLSISEIAYVLALQNKRANMEEVEDNLVYGLKANIKELCGGLVKLKHEDNEDWLHLVHGSVKNFLLSEDAQEFAGFRISEGDAHLMLAMACLHFLTLPEVKDRAGFWYTWDCNCFSKGRSCMRRPKAHPPFYSYAATYWNRHITGITPTEETRSVIKGLMPHLPLSLYEVNRHRSSPPTPGSEETVYPNSCRRRPEETTMIHTAAHFNILWLVEDLVEGNKALVHERIDRGGTPLVFAAERGNLKVIEVLMKAGADVDAQEYDHWTALHWAKTNGHDELAERLIVDWGARQDIKDDCNNWTAGEWGSEWIHSVAPVKGRTACRVLPQISDAEIHKNKEKVASTCETMEAPSSSTWEASVRRRTYLATHR